MAAKCVVEGNLSLANSYRSKDADDNGEDRQPQSFNREIGRRGQGLVSVKHIGATTGQLEQCRRSYQTRRIVETKRRSSKGG
jgi:hypothetical protein